MKSLSNEYHIISGFLNEVLSKMGAAYELRSKKLKEFKEELELEKSNQNQDLSSERLKEIEKTVQEKIFKVYPDKINKTHEDVKKSKDDFLKTYNSDVLNKISDNILLLELANKIVFNKFKNAIEHIDGIKNKTLKIVIQKLNTLEVDPSIEKYDSQSGGVLLVGKDSFPKLNTGNKIDSKLYHDPSQV